jgi:hypothetical protein
MKPTLFLCIALLGAAGAFARPLIVESPNLLPFSTNGAAFDGDELITTESREVDPNAPEIEIIVSANFYKRSAGGQWIFQSQLASETIPEFSGTVWRVAMSASTAAVRMPSGLHIFERTASGWMEDVLDAARPQGLGVDVDGTRILTTAASGCTTQAQLWNPVANGHWAPTALLAVPTGSCFGNFDLDGSEAIALSSSADPAIPDRVRIFEQTGGAWSAVATFDSPESDAGIFGPAIAVHGNLALVSGSDRGAHVYRRDGSGWTEDGLLTTPDSYDFPGQYARSLQITDDYVLEVGWNINRRNDVGYLFRAETDGSFTHLANLVSDGSNGVEAAHISGTRVIAGDSGYVREFELPASFAVPALVQSDFESGTAQWTPRPGSHFSVVSDGTTHVYRQSSTEGDAASVHAADRTDQSISADITPVAFDGDDRWVGLMARYTDDDNYYYVTIRNSTDSIVLKRKQDGIFTTLATQGFDASVGAKHRVTLESSGSRQAVFVDGQLLMANYDKALKHGHAGLRTFKAAADFDNVVVSPGPLQSLTYSRVNKQSGNWSGDVPRFVQSSTASDARLLTGHAREDESVRALVTVDSFAPAGSPWVGLIARYVDAGNYYYVTARKSNEISLRRLNDGAITVLGNASFPVTPGTTFTLKLETIADRVRVYVNDELRIEAGAEIQAGQVGMMTYRAAAVFDDYWAYEP